MARRYFPCKTEDDDHTTYHIFADASKIAYGAVVYIHKGNITSFVIAKARVAPIRKLTLPQLELMAALVATRLGKFVIDSLDNLYTTTLQYTCGQTARLYFIGSIVRRS